MLTDDQVAAVQCACAGNTFVTGPGGTGKSTVLRAAVSMLCAQTKQVLVTSSTATSAIAAGGQTIHTAFSIRSEHTLDQLDVGYVRDDILHLTTHSDTMFKLSYTAVDDALDCTQQTLATWLSTVRMSATRAGVPKTGVDMIRRIMALRRIDTVVIDEVSMVSNDTLLLMDSILRYAKGVHAVMGGTHVIAFGDFYQLRPVPSNAQRAAGILTVPLCCDKRSGAYNVWDQLCMQKCVLTKPHRFNGSVNTFNVMEVIRRAQWDTVNGAIVDSFLRTLEIDPTSTRYDNWTWLFSSNQSKDAHNDMKLKQTGGVTVSIHAVTSGDCRAFPTVPAVLTIAPQARVMCTKNGQYLTLDGHTHVVCNGQLGVVRHIDPRLEYVDVDMDDGMCIRFTAQTWEHAVMRYVPREGYVRDVTSTIRQLPVSLAWAMTIHKAQGMTLDRVVLSFEGVCMPGQAYIAVSRVRSFNRLRFVGYNKSHITADPEAMRYYSSHGQS